MRPVKAGPGEPVETQLTVNGTPALLTMPARVTLADALRDHLGLTGTHVGCEHGVCGMCTVLAADVRPGQAKVIAQRVGQRHPGRQREQGRRSVDGQPGLDRFAWARL